MNKQELIEKINNNFGEEISKQDILSLFPYYSYKRKEYNEYIVYYLLDKDENILYIGRTVDIVNRMRNHFENPNEVHNKEWKSNVVYVKYFELDNFDDMMEYEKGMIRKYSPTYNRALLKTKVSVNEIEEFKIVLKEYFLVKINVKEEDIINKLKEYINEENPDKIILVDWIRNNFYNHSIGQSTIKAMYQRIRDRLKVINNYKLITKCGRGAKAYLEKIL